MSVISDCRLMDAIFPPPPPPNLTPFELRPIQILYAESNLLAILLFLFETQTTRNAGYIGPKTVAGHLARLVPNKDAKILDIGCGTGLVGEEVTMIAKELFLNLVKRERGRERDFHTNGLLLKRRSHYSDNQSPTNDNRRPSTTIDNQLPTKFSIDNRSPTSCRPVADQLPITRRSEADWISNHH